MVTVSPYASVSLLHSSCFYSSCYLSLPPSYTSLYPFSPYSSSPIPLSFILQDDFREIKPCLNLSTVCVCVLFVIPVCICLHIFLVCVCVCVVWACIFISRLPRSDLWDRSLLLLFSPQTVCAHSLRVRQ